MAKVAAFRIAMRTTDEGWWIALLCKIDQPEDQGIEMGRIRRAAAEDPAVRAKFIEVNQLTIANVLKGKGIDVADWQTQKPMGDSKGHG